MKDVSRHYPKLSAAERAALTVEALSRQDSAEVDALADTCPEKTYRSRDAAYTFRLSEFNRLALVYEAEVLRLAIRVVALSALLTNARAKDIATPERCLAAYRDVIGRIKAWHDAWRQLAKLAGVDADTALRAFGICMTEIETRPGFDLGMEAEIVADPETLEAANRALTGHWQRMLEQLPS